MADNGPGWTLDTLHLHHQRQHDDLVKTLDERSENQKDGTNKALIALNERMAVHNGVLASWEKDRANSPTRAEIDARLKPLEEFVATARGRSTGVAETKTGLRLDTGWVFAAIAAVGAIIALVA